MFGANNYGSVYYGQSTGTVYNVFTRTLSASVSTVAKLSKRVSLTRAATPIVTIASLLAPYQKALSRLARAVTKALNYPRTTKAMNYARTTKRTL